LVINKCNGGSALSLIDSTSPRVAFGLGLGIGTESLHSLNLLNVGE